MRLLVGLLCGGLSVLPVSADLSAVRAEPNLERRAERAIVHANGELTSARRAYEAGEIETFNKQLTEIKDAVDLSYQSIEDLGKPVGRRAKQFKRAELAIRTLLRRLETLAPEVSVADRPAVDAVIKRALEVQEMMVFGVMERKSK